MELSTSHNTTTNFKELCWKNNNCNYYDQLPYVVQGAGYFLSAPNLDSKPQLQHKFNPCYSPWWRELKHILRACHFNSASSLVACHPPFFFTLFSDSAELSTSQPCQPRFTLSVLCYLTFYLGDSSNGNEQQNVINSGP